MMLARPDMNVPEVAGLPAGALALQAELKGKQTKPLHRMAWGEASLDVVLGLDSVWLIVRRSGHGGLALRSAYAPGGLAATVTRRQDGQCVIETHSPLGVHEVSISFTDQDVLRVTTTLTPVTDLLIPYLPRDLYPLDAQNDPMGAKGNVEAAQRGVNGGMLYFCMAEPAFGHVFYLQNLTALNAYFAATETTPDGVVGGQWPELGYQPPTMLGNSPPTKALPGGRPTVVSDVHLAMRSDCAQGEQASALLFLDMFAQIYAGWKSRQRISGIGRRGRK